MGCLAAEEHDLFSQTTALFVRQARLLSKNDRPAPSLSRTIGNLLPADCLSPQDRQCKIIDVDSLGTNIDCSVNLQVAWPVDASVDVLPASSSCVFSQPASSEQGSGNLVAQRCWRAAGTCNRAHTALHSYAIMKRRGSCMQLLKAEHARAGAWHCAQHGAVLHHQHVFNHVPQVRLLLPSIPTKFFKIVPVVVQQLLPDTTLGIFISSFLAEVLKLGPVAAVATVTPKKPRKGADDRTKIF